MQESDQIGIAYLNGTEDPQDQGLHDNKGRGADTKRKVHADILANIGIFAFLGVLFGPLL